MDAQNKRRSRERQKSRTDEVAAPTKGTLEGLNSDDGEEDHGEEDEERNVDEERTCALQGMEDRLHR